MYGIELAYITGKSNKKKKKPEMLTIKVPNMQGK